MTMYRRVLLVILGIALLANVYVALSRFQKERHSKHVEIAMDFTDFDGLARSYGYNEEQFLVELRRAGLTSIALSEELGASVGTTSNAIVFSGPALLNQARITPLADPTLAGLIRAGQIKPAEIYLVVYNDTTFARYRRELPTRFGAAAVHVLHATRPYVIAIRTQPDFFAATALGIPDELWTLARKLDLIVDPRVQNDERFGASEIDRIFNSFAHRGKIGTVIFMGIANQVLGYPDHLRDTAIAFKRTRYRFGAIEWYDKLQEQKGTEELARFIPGQTTRVQAISKLELDKLSPETVIGRYLLGVRERNIRVVYLRPYAHLWENRSIEATNVELVRRIAAGLKARGFTLGTATPVPAFRVNPLVVLIASLAVPAIFLLILDALGIARLDLAIVVFGLDLLAIVGGFALHHDMVARKLVALAGALLFPIAAALAIAPAFRGRTGPNPWREGVRALIVAVAVAFAGGLVVVGLISTPLTMEEIDRFTGVKAILVVPPLAILGLYWFTPIFGGRLEDTRRAFSSPVRVVQLVVLGVLALAAYLLVARSGNQSDITPTGFEMALRSNLTAILSVRPRFKEFLIGFPALMLLPSLIPADRRAWGWLFALAVGVGLSDIVDTFSHLHTPLSVSVVRVVLGVLAGAFFGALATYAYRRLRRE